MSIETLSDLLKVIKANNIPSMIQIDYRNTHRFYCLYGRTILNYQDIAEIIEVKKDCFIMQCKHLKGEEYVSSEDFEILPFSNIVRIIFQKQYCNLFFEEEKLEGSF